MKARSRTGLWEMANVAREEAERIRTTQSALVRIGELPAPHPRQAAKADAFDDIADLILTIIPVKKEVAALLAPIIAARAASAGQADPQADHADHQQDNSDE